MDRSRGGSVMFEVFMMGVPYLHEDLPEGEFDTLEEAIECADEKFYECFVYHNDQTVYNNGEPNAEELEPEHLN
jgi:hypothetical protein